MDLQGAMPHRSAVTHVGADREHLPTHLGMIQQIAATGVFIRCAAKEIS